MHRRERTSRRWAPLLLLFTAVVAGGCQDDGSDARTDALFAPGGPNPKLQAVTVQLGPQNSDGADVNGGWFVAAYSLASGRMATGFADCDTGSCSTALTVPTGTYAFIAFPGRRSDFPGYVPLPPESESWDCVVDGCADPTSAAVVTQLVGGEIGSAPLARWTFGSGFVVEISNRPPPPVVLVPPPAVLVELEYEDLEQFNPDEGNFGDTQPRSTSVVFPLCWTDAPYDGWDLSIPSDGNGALPAVPLTGAVANPARLPMPDYAGFEGPGSTSCAAYTGLTGLPFTAFVYELDFSGTPFAQGETLLSTYATDALPTAGTITQYTQPLLCDASVGKYADEIVGDGAKLDFLPPIVSGFQADVADDLVLTPIPEAIAGWYSQRITIDGTSAALTIKNRGRKGTYSLTASYTCSSTGCSLDGVNTNTPGPVQFEMNFRPGDGPGVVEASWSWVGLPYPVDGKNRNTVTWDLKTAGDDSPESSRSSTTSSDFAIPFPQTCKDTNDGRWAV
jgi:hypothetical protein